MERISTKLSVVISVITLLTVFLSGCFWFYKTDSLPKKVEEHDKRIAELEKQMVMNNTKTELIYQAVLEIRRAVVYK